MRKKFIIVLFNLMFLLFISPEKVNAVVGTFDYNVKYKIHTFITSGIEWQVGEVKREESQETFLKENLGYQGEGLQLGTNCMKFVTNIEIIEKDKRSKIRVGKEIKDYHGNEIADLSDDELKKFGYDESSGATSWPVVLFGGYAYSLDVGAAQTATSTTQYWYLIVNEAYSGDDDYNKGLDKEPEGAVANIETTTVQDVAKNFLSEALSKFFIMLIEFVRGLYGDGPQMLLNSIQTTQYGTGIHKFLPWKITYEKDEYNADSDKNAYVNFSADGSNEGNNGQKKVEVSASENQFDEDTEIPVIPVDVYTLSVGQVSALDINFLTGQNNTELHSTDSVWTKLRNLAAGVIHITIYIGAAFLIATLIWHGICIVKGTFTPDDEKKHKEGLQDFAVGVAMLAGSIIIMAVCIFASKVVFEDMEISSTKELPIRIALADNGSNIYSFSTNVTGYVRYMSETQNTSLITKKLKYTIIYIICVWLNIISVIIMLIRMIAIIILSILGPIIAVAYAMKKQGVFNITYKTWTIHYVLWSSIQLIFAIAYRIILEVAF